MRLTTTRQAIHDALAWGYIQRGQSGVVEYLTYLTRIEKSIRNSDPTGDFLEAAYICAAINTLPGALSSWLKFAYGPDATLLDLMQNDLASRMRSELFNGTMSLKKHQRMFSMALTSLEDYRLRYRRNREMPDAVYCERMEVHQPNFYRDGWNDKKEECLNLIKQWDRESVGHISRIVRSLNGDNEERPSEVLQALANDKF